MGAAQQENSGGRRTSSATIRATLIRAPVTLDGRLDEPFWAAADSSDDFRQREPLEGSPTTERTVVRVAHDADALYIVVRCYDSNMRSVRASQLRRDADLSSDDNVRLLIDSCAGRRSCRSGDGRCRRSFERRQRPSPDRQLRRPAQLSIRRRTLSSLERSASRRSWLARTLRMLES